MCLRTFSWGEFLGEGAGDADWRGRQLNSATPSHRDAQRFLRIVVGHMGLFNGYFYCFIEVAVLHCILEILLNSFGD